MANITLDELRAKYPPEDRNEYDRAYAAATLAGQLAELVCALRARAGLTQTELARRMGTTQSSIARIEGGGSLPTLGMLARLAHATGTPQRLAAPESPTSTSAEPPDQIHAARLWPRMSNTSRVSATNPRALWPDADGFRWMCGEGRRK